jgi:hypothetical protein
MHERRYWPSYMEAYEEAVAATSSHHAPWHLVPADDKENARLIVARILVEALEDLKLAPPTLTSDQLADLKAFRQELAAEGPI